jgi:exosortase
LSTISGTTSLEYAAPIDEPPETLYLGLSGPSWGKIAVVVALFSAVFWPNLHRLWQKTNPFTGEANWGHAIAIPIIGLYYLYIHREDLMKAGPRQFIWDRFLRRGRLWAAAIMIAAGVGFVVVNDLISNPALMTVRDIAASAAEATAILGLLVLVLDWSLAVTLFGLGLFVYGIYPGQNDYTKDLGMVVTLYGITLLMCGREVMKIAWFPIAFLICGLPWPGLVYSWVASPLQVLAANVAVEVLKLTGVDAACSGTKIIMFGNGMHPSRMLNVAEACAGMRSLMTFITVGGAVAFLSARPLWQKLTITVSAIPIAIFCNVMRVSGQGLLDHYVSQKLSESFAHQFVGMIMLLPAFFLILFVGFLLDRIFIEEVDDRNPAPARPRGAAVAAPAAAPKMAAIPARKTAIPAMQESFVQSVAAPGSVGVKPGRVAQETNAKPQAAGVRPAATPPRPGGPGGLTPPRPRSAASLMAKPGRPATTVIVPPKNGIQPSAKMPVNPVNPTKAADPKSAANPPSVDPNSSQEAP